MTTATALFTAIVTGAGLCSSAFADNGAAEAAAFGPDMEPTSGKSVELLAEAPIERAFTFYLAQISSEEGWEDVMVNPLGAGYVGSYLAVAAISDAYREYRGGRVQLEWEGQVAYNFGAQEYWEFNAVPLLLRWKQWPWTHNFASSAAFGLGLSYTSELSNIEVELENESHQLLIYWVAEVTAGPSEGPWALSLRLHHRSVAYGLMGEDGGMNAIGLGLRWSF